MAKPAKVFQPVIATANALRTGDVVFRTGAGLWSRNVAKAHFADTPEASGHLQTAVDADIAANLVVDGALILAVRDDGGVRPLALRERIRATGPTIALPVDADSAAATDGTLATAAQDI